MIFSCLKENLGHNYQHKAATPFYFSNINEKKKKSEIFLTITNIFPRESILSGQTLSEKLNIARQGFFHYYFNL